MRTTDDDEDDILVMHLSDKPIVREVLLSFPRSVRGNVGIAAPAVYICYGHEYIETINRGQRSTSPP